MHNKALTTFLAIRRVVGDEPFTHESIENGVGKRYCIVANDMPYFMKLYNEAFLEGTRLSLAEVHKTLSPIIMYFKFKQGNCSDRLYNVDVHVKPIIKAIIDTILDFVHCPRSTFYVLERPAPVPDPEIPDCFEDGFRLHFPNIVTRPEIQYAIRHKFLYHHANKLCVDTRVSNRPAQIYNKYSIHHDNWMLYGSMHQGDEAPWEVVYLGVKRGSPMGEHETDLVNRLSITYNVADECIYTTMGRMAITLNQKTKLKGYHNSFE